MKEFILKHKKPDEILTMVRSMREAGMVQGKDFDFAYNKASYDDLGYEAVTPEHTIFKFYDERWATWFALKWV